MSRKGLALRQGQQSPEAASYMQGVTCNDGDMQADFMHTLLPLHMMSGPYQISAH